MIRDPSDGSVREPKKSAPERLTSQNTAERLPSSDAAVSGAGTSSGLPLESTKPENIAKLEKAREWLRDYHAKKQGTSK